MVSLDYKSGRSLHAQIKDNIKELIISGMLSENEQLPSVRELSVKLTVNPNTVQRAYRELEGEGYIYSIPGKGSFVSWVDNKITKEKIEGIYKEVASLVNELAYLGEAREKIIGAVNSALTEREDKK